MSNIIKQSVGNVSSNGNGLAIYLDVVTNEVMLKDVHGNTQYLKEFFKYNDILFFKTDTFSFVFANETNNLNGDFSAIISGEYNLIRANNSIILGGNANTISEQYSSIMGGKGNTIESQNSTISGGINNKTKYDNTHISGSNIEADREDTLFCNNLSIKNIPTSNKGLPKGSIWSNKGILSIVT